LTVQGPAQPPGGRSFYASPNGSPSGDGSITRPWDLQTALSHPAAVLPGDTIYLRGGTYRGAFTSRLRGTATARITVRSYPGEWAKIDGNNGLTTLARSIDGDDLIIALTDGTDFPNGMLVQIDAEVIQLGGKNGNTYSNCVRQRAGGDIVSAGQSHAAGATVIRRKTQIFTVSGYYADYRDFEVFNSLGAPFRLSRFNVGTNNSGWGGTRGDALGVMAGPNNRIINLVLHDGADGVTFSTHSKEALLYGSIIFNNGWNGNLSGDRDPCKNHGQNLYLQGDLEPKAVKHNVIFSSYAGAKIFSSSEDLKNFTVDGNVMFNAGVPACRVLGISNRGENNLQAVAGSSGFHVENLVIKNNTLYHAPNVVGRNFWLASSGNVNGQVTDNRILGSHQGFDSSSWNGFTFTGNTVHITDDGPVASNPLSVVIRKNSSSPPYIWHSNTYFNASLTIKPFRFNGSDYAFSNFKATSGLDAFGSSYFAHDPTGTHVQVIPNEFETGRGTIIVENYSLAPTVTVDLSSLGLQTGDTVKIYKAENWPNVLHSFTYNLTNSAQSTAFQLNMSDTRVTQPVGVAAGTIPSMAPRFGVYIVKKCPCPW
jgi:hypothetical protein